MRDNADQGRSAASGAPRPSGFADPGDVVLPPAWVARAAGIGVAAGLLSGLFGVGGGIVMVPLFAAWFALDQRLVSATSLLAIIPIATSSAAGYALQGNVDLRAGLLLLVGGVVGGQVGARLLPRTPIPTLQVWFGVISVATAVRLVTEDPGGGGGLGGTFDALLLVGIGVIAGVLAGLLGVGGGIVMVPGLVLLAGDNADTARGTSLFVVIGTALTASVTNLRNGLVLVRPALVAGAAGVPAGFAGAALGLWLPGRAALALFAVLLVWSGGQMLVRGLRGRRAARGVVPTTGPSGQAAGPSGQAAGPSGQAAGPSSQAAGPSAD